MACPLLHRAAIMTTTETVKFKLTLISLSLSLCLCIVTDQVAWFVCRSVTLVSPAKTAELIEMPFGLRTPVGPGTVY